MIRPGRHDEAGLRRMSVRLGLQIGLLLLAVLAVVSTLVVLVVIGGQQRQTSATLDQAIAVTHGDGGRRPDGDDADVRDVSVAVSDPHGTRVDGTMPAGLPDRSVMAQVARTGVTDERRISLGGVRYAVRTARHGDDTIQAVLSLHEESEEITRLLQALLIGGGAGVLLVAGVAAVLSRRAVRPMADALALQRRFVADAAHELRTPLTLLSTRAQLLGRRLDRRDPDPGEPAQVRADVRGLVDDSASLAAILEDLLLAADRSAPLPPEPVDLAEVAAAATESARANARSHDVSLELDGAGGRAGAVVERGSRTALLRVAHALIDNAIGHARSRVEVGVGGDDRSVELVVGDDGPGVAPEAVSSIFDRFSGSRSDADQGSRRHYGLGLALVSDVAARHGGTVEVRARPDGTPGAVFVVRLPRHP